MKPDYEIGYGEGRARLSLTAFNMGPDLVVLIYNENLHAGAVAVADYKREGNIPHPSVSVMTRYGHKDDAVAQKAAYLISKNIGRGVCVIGGIHLDNVTRDEIQQILVTADRLIEKFIRILKEESAERGK